MPKERRQKLSFTGEKQRIDRLKAVDPDHLTDKEVHQVLLEVLQISPIVERTARRIFHYSDQYAQIADGVDHPEVMAYIGDQPDLSQIIRLGFYTRVVSSCIELITEAHKFVDDPRNHFTSPKIVGRHRSPEGLAEYIRRYKNFPKVVDLMIREAESLVGGWMNRRVNVDDLDSENPYAKVVAKGHTLGDILVVASKAIQRQGLDQGHTFNSYEFTHFMELFHSVIAQEAQAAHPVIQVVEMVHEEKLSKVFFDLAGSFEYTAAPDTLQKLPHLLKDAYKDGLPLYRVLYAAVKQLPEALSHEDHPGHPVSAKIVNHLNDFALPDQLFSPDFTSEMFNFMLCAGQIQQEFAGKGSFQEFVFKLEKLANAPGDNQDWYQGLLDYMVRGSTHFPHKVITHPHDVERYIFDLSRIKPQDFSLSDRVYEILDASEYQIMEISVDENFVPIADTSLRGEKYDSIMHIHKMDEHLVLINVMVTVVTERDEPDQLGLTRDMARLSYQVSIRDGRISLFVPITHRDLLKDASEAAILHHVSEVIGLIDVDALRQKTLEEKREQRKSQNGRHHQKSGIREERMAAYDQQRSNTGAQEAGQKRVRNTSVQLNPQTFEDDSANERDNAKYVPRELILSRELQEQLITPIKKGAQSRLSKELERFLKRYNAATESKPGKGIPYTALNGKFGVRIWRFWLTYDDRCVAVEVGQGKALVVYVGNHEDIYQDYDKVAQKVETALNEYDKQIPKDR